MTILPLRRIARALSLVVIGALVGLAGCSGDGSPPSGPPAPVPGTLTVSLVTPNADDRAILVRVTGPEAMTAIASSSGYTVHARVTGNTFRAAAFGDLAGGALLTFDVPDVSRKGEYIATVVEASDAGNALRGDLSGYRLTIVR